MRADQQPRPAAPAAAPQPRRGRRPSRRVLVLGATLAVVLALGAAETVARGVVGEHLARVRADLPPGVEVDPGPTPALWQALTATADLRVAVDADALAEVLMCATGREGLTVTSAPGTLTVRAGLDVGGTEVPAEVDLGAAVKDGELVLRAEQVRAAGFTVPAQALAARVPALGRLVDGVHVGGAGLVVSSVRTDADGLEVGLHAGAGAGLTEVAGGGGQCVGG